jgi:hypothetical protein
MNQMLRAIGSCVLLALVAGVVLGVVGGIAVIVFNLIT